MTAWKRVSTDWWVLAVAVLIVGLVAIASVRHTTQTVPLDVTSAAPDGALALSLWLGQDGHAVTTASTSGPRFDSLSPHTTVILMQAGMDLSQQDTSAATAFMRRGGTLAIATDGSYNLDVLRRFGIVTTSDVGFNPLVVQPLLRAPTVADIRGFTDATLHGQNRDVSIIRSQVGAVLLQRRVGHGTLWAFSAPSLFKNQAIESGAHDKLILNMVGERRTAIVFDQHPPAASSLPSDWLTQTTWGVALIFIIVVALLYRWLAGRRLGPPVIPLSDRHRATSEYVVSMAGLLRRSRSRAEILHTYQQRLIRLRDREGRITPEQHAAMELLTRPQPDISEAELVRSATAITRLEDELVRANA